MINSISIENFKVIKYLQIDDLERFNLIVGKNNSGKTSILEALFQSINPGNAALLGKINRFRNLNLLNPDTWKTIFYKLDINSDVILESELKSLRERRIIKITPIIKQEQLLIEKERKNGLVNGDSSAGLNNSIEGLNLNFTIIQNNKEKDYFSRIINNKKIPPYLESGSLIQPFISENDENYECPTNGKFIHPLNIFDNLGDRFSKIVIQKQKDEIIKILQNLEPELSNLELVGASVYVDLNYKELVQIRTLGDGILKLFSFLIDIIRNENGILLIDEIENGLHYSTLNLVWKSIFSLAKKYNVQIIATTHSYDCVRSLYNCCNEISNSHDINLGIKDAIRVFRIERKQGDKFKAIKYTSSNLEKALERDWEIR